MGSSPVTLIIIINVETELKNSCIVKVVFILIYIAYIYTHNILPKWGNSNLLDSCSNDVGAIPTFGNFINIFQIIFFSLMR
jgi:hypothetical protein